MRRLAAGIVVAWLAAVAMGAEGEKKGWEVVKGGGYAIAVPAGWRNLDIGGRMVLFRQGDGTHVPITDEDGAPVQVGLTVEKFPVTKESPQEGAKKLLANAKRSPRLELVGDPVMETIKLGDGTEAVILVMEFLKDEDRSSLQMKMLARDKASNGWVVGGYLVAGKGSTMAKKDGKWGKWLKAHVASFVFDAPRLDEKKVGEAYEAVEKAKQKE